MTTAEARCWNTIAEIWREAHAHALWRTHRDAVNSTLLEEWWPKGPVERVLKTDLFDEALGDGLYPLLGLRAASIIGMDISTVTAQAAVTSHHNSHAVGADARCLPFIDEAFDVIVSNSTLDHFGSPAALGASLHERHRVLKTPGLLIITLDNRANPMVALRNAVPFPLLSRLGLVPNYVGATYGPRGLRLLLQQTGFRIGETSAILHCPRVIAVLTAGVLQRYAGTKTQRRFLQLLLSFERLSCWPTRFLTGYFVAVRALKLYSGFHLSVWQDRTRRRSPCNSSDPHPALSQRERRDSLAMAYLTQPGAAAQSPAASARTRRPASARLRRPKLAQITLVVVVGEQAQ